MSQLRTLAVSLVLSSPILGASCTKAQETAVTTAAGPVCEVTMAVVGEPQLAPLCTTADQIALAVEALIASAQSAQIDAGTLHMTALVRPSQPTPREIYDWLVAHGAVPVGG